MTKILIDEAVVRQAMEAFDCIYSPLHVREISMVGAAMTDLRQALAEAALDKMADNARELVLNYEQPAPAQEPKAYALKAAYLAGFRATGEGYNAECPFEDKDPEQDAYWLAKRDEYVRQAFEQSSQEPVPKGWKLVPLEMTDAMFQAYNDAPYNDDERQETNDAWKATLNAAPPAPAQPLTDVIKAAQGVLEWTEIAHRPPVRDRLEAGRMAMVRVHALADLHDALLSRSITKGN